MARPDWLRTFVAIYRAGSVTEGARVRALSQPAASQQLSSLEAAVGGALFIRTAEGVIPNDRGRALYAEVVSALDQLELVLAGLDAGRVEQAQSPLRIGSSAEFFSACVLPLMAETDLAVVTHFGSDDDLIERVETGELDVAITSRTPPRRSLGAVQIGEKRFVLVTARGAAPDHEFASLGDVCDWLAERPWVAYSLELPITRRFWQMHLGRPFAARLRLVAPDLRAVLGAVEQGLGCSLLPAFVCAESLARGRIVEVHPVTDLIAPEPWYCCFREGEATRPSVASLLSVLSSWSKAGGSGWSPPHPAPVPNPGCCTPHR